MQNLRPRFAAPYFTVVIVSILTLCFLLISTPTEAASGALKEGMKGNAVATLQKDLKTLGFFNEETTGYYGEVTTEAVKRLQKKYKLDPDGIAGESTLKLIDRLLGRKQATVSRGEANRNEYLIPWFGGAENVFAKEMVATIYDIETGLSFKAKRTYGYNHADCEPLTLKDTQIMKKIYGGSWDWDRRAVIVTVNGRKIAASMAGMPHAGNEKAPAEAYVKSRSGGYGAGDNLDEVKGNGMSGHFDLHFLGSKTHGTNRVDEEHQNMVKKAAAWAEENL